MEYLVYILRSEKDGSYYIGHTSDLDKRLRHHNEQRSTYTRGKVPWKLIYHEVFTTRSEAMKREQEIKRMKSREYIERLVRASRALLGEVVPTQGRDRSRQIERG
jgi:putative endonuclease